MISIPRALKQVPAGLGDKSRPGDVAGAGGGVNIIEQIIIHRDIDAALGRARHQIGNRTDHGGLCQVGGGVAVLLQFVHGARRADRAPGADFGLGPKAQGAGDRLAGFFKGFAAGSAPRSVGNNRAPGAVTGAVEDGYISGRFHCFSLLMIAPRGGGLAPARRAVNGPDNAGGQVLNRVRHNNRSRKIRVLKNVVIALDADFCPASFFKLLDDFAAVRFHVNFPFSVYYITHDMELCQAIVCIYLHIDMEFVDVFWVVEDAEIGFDLTNFANECNLGAHCNSDAGVVEGPETHKALAAPPKRGIPISKVGRPWGVPRGRRGICFLVFISLGLRTPWIAQPPVFEDCYLGSNARSLTNG